MFISGCSLLLISKKCKTPVTFAENPNMKINRLNKQKRRTKLLRVSLKMWHLCMEGQLKIRVQSRVRNISMKFSIKKSHSRHKLLLFSEYLSNLISNPYKICGPWINIVQSFSIPRVE